MEGINFLSIQTESIIKKYKELAEITGENFNIFKITGLETDEVKLHSSLISELLNPKGSHGQKDKFLKLFLKQINFENFISESATVKNEMEIGVISNDYLMGGRIDIFLKDINNNQIIIENKIYAEDQKNQLLRYYNYNEKASIYYLTLKGDDPSEFSTGSIKSVKDSVKSISYSDDITPWLYSCKKEAVDLPLLRETIAQYINLINLLIGKSMNQEMKNEMIKLLLNNPKSIENAIRIENSVLDAKIELQKKFWIRLKEKLKIKYDTEITEHKLDDKSLMSFYTNKGGENFFYQGLYFNIHNINKTHSIQLFVGNIYNDPAFRIMIVDKDNEPLGEEIKQIDYNEKYLQVFRDCFYDYPTTFQTIRDNSSGWIYTKFKHHFKQFNTPEVYNMTDPRFMEEKVDDLFNEISSILITYFNKIIF